MNDQNANTNTRLIHDQTRALVQKAAVAPYGHALDLIREAGYWDASQAPEDGLETPVWLVEVEVTISGRARLEIEAATEKEAREMAHLEIREIGAPDFDEETIIDHEITAVEPAP